MRQNDPVGLLLILHPIMLAAIVWFWGLGSLLLVAAKTKSVKSVFLKNPGIIIGDGFLLPLAAFFIVLSYQKIDTPIPPANSVFWSAVTFMVSLIITLLSRKRFNLTSIWWLPHGLFYLFMSYIVITFITKTTWQFMNQNDTKLWPYFLIVLFAVLIHQTLGVIWSKKFPDI